MSTTRTKLLSEVPENPVCASTIWGDGEIIRSVQMARLFNDSKTFVDLKLKMSEELVQHNFRQLESYPKPNRRQLMDFVRDNFEMEENVEFESWIPVDWSETPEYLKGLEEKPLIYVGDQVS
jgi:alpha,alpha-trehalase